MKLFEFERRGLVFSARSARPDEFRGAVERPFRCVFGRDLMLGRPRAGSTPLLSILILSHEQKLIGWHFGHFPQSDLYYMANSAILPPYRRLGIYLQFGEKLIEWLRFQGVTQIISHHRAGNTSILAAKIRLGFEKAGQIQDPRFGELDRYVRRT